MDLNLNNIDLWLLYQDRHYPSGLSGLRWLVTPFRSIVCWSPSSSRPLSSGSLFYYSLPQRTSTAESLLVQTHLFSAAEDLCR